MFIFKYAQEVSANLIFDGWEKDGESVCHANSRKGRPVQAAPRPPTRPLFLNNCKATEIVSKEGGVRD